MVLGRRARPACSLFSGSLFTPTNLRREQHAPRAGVQSMKPWRHGPTLSHPMLQNMYFETSTTFVPVDAKLFFGNRQKKTRWDFFVRRFFKSIFMQVQNRQPSLPDSQPDKSTVVMFTWEHGRQVRTPRVGHMRKKIKPRPTVTCSSHRRVRQ